MLQAIITGCAECGVDRCLSRNKSTGLFDCRVCDSSYTEGEWYQKWAENRSDYTTYAYMSRNRSKTPHGRRVLGLPSGHPDLWASSEKDAMRICEKHDINYETQEFLTGEAKSRAIEAARAEVGVNS